MHKFFAFSNIRLPSVNSDFHKPGVSEGGTLMTLRVEESTRKGVKASLRVSLLIHPFSD